jgi:hypothetical protein
MIIVNHSHLCTYIYQWLVLPGAPRFRKHHLQLIFRHHKINKPSENRLQFGHNVYYLLRYTHLDWKRFYSPSAEGGRLHILPSTPLADFRTATSKVHRASVIALFRPPKVNNNYNWGPSMNCNQLRAAWHFLWAGGLCQSLANDQKRDPSEIHKLINCKFRNKYI